MPNADQPTAPPDGGVFRRTLVRVLAVQAVALVLLALLQLGFDR